jgi:excinuclease ABC subunit B
LSNLEDYGTLFKTSVQKLANNPSEIAREIEKLKEKMRQLSKKLEFEEAAKVRDSIKRLQILELNVALGS